MDEEKQGVPSPEGEGSSETTAVVVHSGGAKPPAPPPPPGSDDDEDPEEQGMLRMSFMEHLEELRSRIIKALYGLLFAFIFAVVFAGKLWDIISDPAVDALKHLGVVPPRLVMITPMEGFMVIWVQLPLLCSVFLASPWIVYQVWAFISPGLYKRERRWAAPFVLTTAGLFIAGGLFAYFLAFRFGLEFLLSVGMVNGVQPVVSITEYFDLFVNVTLGVGLVFELPVLIFLLTLLRVVSPRFLLRHSRYAILAIVIAAAIITPTPDVFNLMLFAIPMCALYFVGVFFGYLLVLRREGKQFPWKPVLRIGLIILAVVAIIYFVLTLFHLHLSKHWPYVLHSQENQLSPAEKSAGWKLLFNGKDMSGWVDPRQKNPPGDAWTVEDGCLKAHAKPSITEDLFSQDTFGDFELVFDWRISPGGNSGVKYRIQDHVFLHSGWTGRFEDLVNLSLKERRPDRPARGQDYVIGFEYQILDNARNSDARVGLNHTAGALYDMVPPVRDASRPVGEFNHSRILLRGDHVEHWLNDVKVVDADLNASEVKAHIAKRWTLDSPVYTLLAGEGKHACPISLQNHGDDAWFRNIKIRPAEVKK